MVCQWKILYDSGVLNIIRNVTKRRLRWYHFLKRWLKLSPSETSNLVYVIKKFYRNDNILYIVGKVLKNAKMLLNGNIFENVDEHM